MAWSSRVSRVQIGMVLAALLAGVAALVWGRTIAGDDGDVVRLDSPGEYADPAISNPPHDGERLPAVEVVSVEGDRVTLAGDGRPMVINLWYSSCPPCARELVYFGAVEAEHGDEVRFVGVNPLDDAAEAVDFAVDRGADYEQFLDYDGNLEDALGVVQFPVTLFVTADGEIAAQTGPLTEADLRERVAELLA